MRSELTAPFLLPWLLAGVAPAAPSVSCAPCHREIYESYRRTPMALSSGQVRAETAIERFDAPAASFSHAPSGFTYQVRKREDGGMTVRFDNPAEPGLSGEKNMPYFAGSGAAARSYLLASDGFLFISPATWYSGAGGHWNLTPAYRGYGYPFLTRPAQPGCLTCHASFLNPVAGTQNRYADPPFDEGGVACERCHGAGEAHIARRGGGGIVNPAKLAADRRDSVCAQCHLSGEAPVMRAGADWRTYRPGDRLADSVTVFVNREPRRAVTSHVENLAQSRCKQAAGDKLWCGTCHNPHSLPEAAERVGYFAVKCRACHEAGKQFREHGSDCVSCHMPAGAVSDAEHVVYTDHSIRRRPLAAANSPSVDGSTELRPFGGARASTRDTALAYAIVAGRSPALRARAREGLEAALAQTPGDTEVLLYLAEIYRNSGEEARALPLYQRAAELDPLQLTASAGLGAIYFQRGDMAAAVRHWRDALKKNPGLVLVATNMAMAQWTIGDREGARETLRKVTELSPAFRPAIDLLKKLNSAE